jgi:signal transduction histidine kinase
MPAVRIEGPVDTAVPDEVRPQLLAVLREGLSNVARHAQATEAVVDLSCGGGEVALAVSDNGVGPPADQIIIRWPMSCWASQPPMVWA